MRQPRVSIWKPTLLLKKVTVETVPSDQLESLELGIRKYRNKELDRAYDWEW